MFRVNAFCEATRFRAYPQPEGTALLPASRAPGRMTLLMQAGAPETLMTPMVLLTEGEACFGLQVLCRAGELLFLHGGEVLRDGRCVFSRAPRPVAEGNGLLWLLPFSDLGEMEQFSREGGPMRVRLTGARLQAEGEIPVAVRNFVFATYKACLAAIDEEANGKD